jgi:hypothetical protein
MEVIMVKFLFFPDIFLVWLTKTMKNLSLVNRHTTRDSNRVPPKYRSEALPQEPVIILQIQLHNMCTSL